MSAPGNAINPCLASKALSSTTARILPSNYLSCKEGLHGEQNPMGYRLVNALTVHMDF